MQRRELYEKPWNPHNFHTHTNTFYDINNTMALTPCQHQFVQPFAWVSCVHFDWPIIVAYNNSAGLCSFPLALCNLYPLFLKVVWLFLFFWIEPSAWCGADNTKKLLMRMIAPNGVVHDEGDGFFLCVCVLLLLWPKKTTTTTVGRFRLILKLYYVAAFYWWSALLWFRCWWKMEQWDPHKTNIIISMEVRLESRDDDDDVWVRYADTISRIKYTFYTTFFLFVVVGCLVWLMHDGEALL